VPGSRLIEGPAARSAMLIADLSAQACPRGDREDRFVAPSLGAKSRPATPPFHQRDINLRPVEPLGHGGVDRMEACSPSVPG
jgi:hypothetical protein